MNYSFSLASYLLEFIKSYSTYRQGVDGINDQYLSNGNTHGYRVRLSKMLMRNQSNKLKASFQIHHKSRKNYFESVLVETSSYKTTHVQADLSHTKILPWGQIVTKASAYRGTRMLGARDDKYAYEESDYERPAQYEFKKYTLNSNLHYKFNDPTYTFDTTLHIQYADDNLFSADKLSLGSDYSVRGYSGNYYGNKGWYFHNNFTKKIGNYSLYLGLDYGKMPCSYDNENACGEMYGSGIGFRSNHKYFSSDLSVVRPLKSLSEDFEKENLFKYTFTMKF